MMTNVKPNMEQSLIRFKNIHDLSYLFCFTIKHFSNFDFLLLGPNMSSYLKSNGIVLD